MRPRLVEGNEDPGTTAFDYERASRDFRRYLPLKLATFVWFVLVFAMGTYALSAVWLTWWPFTALSIDTGGPERLAINCVAGSLLGATAYSFRGFYWAVGPQSDTNPRYRYDPNWTFWYVARPIAGMVLGAVIYAALRAGVASLGAPSTDATAAASYFVAGFLAGFASTEFFAWLERLATRTFGREVKE